MVFKVQHTQGKGSSVCYKKNRGVVVSVMGFCSQ